MNEVLPFAHGAQMRVDSFPTSFLTRLAHALRRAGVKVSSEQLLDATQALDLVGLTNSKDARAALRCTLVSGKVEMGIFDSTFERLIKEAEAGSEDVDALSLNEAECALDPRATPRASAELTNGSTSSSDLVAATGVGSEEGGASGDQLPLMSLYSSAEALRTQDLQVIRARRQDFGERLIQSLAIEVNSRRRRASVRNRGRRVDLRRSLTRALRSGGELLEIEMRARDRHQGRLILICDVSGSMSGYSSELVHLAYQLRLRSRSTEVFLFGTRLTRISGWLSAGDWALASSRIAQAARDRGAGTRIGLSLREFNQTWARRVLTRRPVVLFISDGWDLGAPESLSVEMRRLQRNSKFVIWLNPLLSSPGYEPVTRALEGALPYVDAFLPLEDILKLGRMPS